MRVQEYSDCSISSVGVYSTGPNPDTISLNVCNMEKYTTYQRAGTVTHEFGHALDFGHNLRKDSGVNDSIMYTCSACTGYNTPQAHDRNDYYYRWIV